MLFIKKVLSVLVVNAAVFIITLSFMAWIVDDTLLNAEQLTKSFDKNKVAAAIAEALPHMAAPDKGEQPNGQPVEPSDPLELQKAQDTVRKVADEPYVRTKINGLVTNVISYIKTGEPRPTIDLTDFAARVQAETGEVPADFADKISKPIDIAEETDGEAFSNINKSYGLLKLFKIIGPVIAVVLLVIEWLLTPKGKKLGKIAWVGIAAGLWGLFWWFVISRAPDFIATRVSAEQATEKALVNVVNALIRSLSDLLALRFLQFGVVCTMLGIAIIMVRWMLGRMGRTQPVVGTRPPSVAVQKPVSKQ